MSVLNLLFLALFGMQGFAQGKQELTINEPGIYDLRALNKRADAVALVEIVSGDTEHYERVVYKAKVVTGFKRSHPGEVVYFGPFVGNRLGTEYLLFLLDTHQQLISKDGNAAGYGPVHYWEVFNEGYTSMETSYQCVFEGKEPAAACDYGVRVCTDYIKLPQSMSAFPPKESDPPFGCRWVRKTLMTSFLDKLASSE